MLDIYEDHQLILVVLVLCWWFSREYGWTSRRKEKKMGKYARSIRLEQTNGMIWWYWSGHIYGIIWSPHLYKKVYKWKSTRQLDSLLLIMLLSFIFF